MPLSPSFHSATRIGLLVLALLALPACDGGTDDTASADLVGRFQARDRYTPLADALALTRLDDALASGGPYTVLAPTRIALAYLGTDFAPVLFADDQRAVLTRVLRHHIVAGRLTPDDFADGATLTAIDGSTLRVRRVGPVVTVNGVTVDVTDPLDASNGVAYPVADVLLDVITTAERVRLSPLLSTLAAGLRDAGVQTDALPRYTVLAPINDAFSALGGDFALLRAAANADVYRRVLRAHVLPGEADLDALVGQTVTTLGGEQLAVTRDATAGLRVDGVRVLVSEVTADGRVYVLGEPVLSVLSVGERLRIRADLTRFASDAEANAAVRAVLPDRARTVTVFATSDFAYANRYPPLAAALAEPAQATLRRRLTALHVVPGRYARADLTDGLRLTALDGTVLTVRRDGDSISLDGRVISGEPVPSVNGLLYTVGDFFQPDVDLFETLLLQEHVTFFRAIRQAGLEQAYRTSIRTAFVLADTTAARDDLLNNPGLALLLQRTATAEFIPRLDVLPYPHTFAALNGDMRTLNRFDCTLIPPLSRRGCSPYGFEFVRTVFPPPDPKDPPLFVDVPTPQVNPGSTTKSGTAVFHLLRESDVVPRASRLAAR